MSVMTAALVLAWLCLILLAFGLAGLLRQVRDLQVDLVQLGAQRQRPLRGRRVAEFAGPPAAILVVDPRCGLCAPVAETFAELAPTAPGLRFEVLSYRASDAWPDSERVRRRVDERLYQQLDVPWAPALLTTDDEGVIISAGPVDSPADLRSQVSRLVAAVPDDTGPNEIGPDETRPAATETTRG